MLLEVFARDTQKQIIAQLMERSVLKNDGDVDGTFPVISEASALSAHICKRTRSHPPNERIKVKQLSKFKQGLIDKDLADSSSITVD